MASAGDGCLTVSRIRPMHTTPMVCIGAAHRVVDPWWTQVVLPSSARIDLILSS